MLDRRLNAKYRHSHHRYHRCQQHDRHVWHQRQLPALHHRVYVEKGFVKDVACQFCGVIFQSTRSDAKRCDSCRQKYLQEYRRREETKLRRKQSNRLIRERLFEGYGGKCVCCGESRFEFLALDHVNGGGRKERQTMSTQQIALRAIREGFPPAYRVLCHNCNQAIGWYGTCPHELERTS